MDPEPKPADEDAEPTERPSQPDPPRRSISPPPAPVIIIERGATVPPSRRTGGALHLLPILTE